MVEFDDLKKIVEEKNCKFTRKNIKLKQRLRVKQGMKRENRTKIIERETEEIFFYNKLHLSAPSVGVTVVGVKTEPSILVSKQLSDNH